MGAGFLPVAIKNNTFYFLFSREMILEGKDAGKWSDFGGSKENNETRYETAIREGWEESTGFFGDKDDIKNLIKHKTLKKITVNKYTTYIVLVNYDDKLPKKFRKKYLKKLQEDRDFVLKHNGFYEKDMVKWVRLDKLQHYINKKTFFRRFYNKVVIQILKAFSV